MSPMSRRRFTQTAITVACSMDVGRATGTAEAEGKAGSLTDVTGVRVGHFTDKRRPTGCTAILFDGEAAAGADYDGSAPGSYLGVLLRPVSPVQTIHAMLLTGGGLMGLPAVAGAVRFLEDKKIGFNWGTSGVPIPIVVGGVIADLEVGDPHVRPDAEAAYNACLAASTAPVAEGNVGVGAGATVGKMLQASGCGGMKGGLGTASLRLGDAVIGAIAVLNAVGDVVDWRSGKIIAGARRPDGKGFVNTVEMLKTQIPGRNVASLPVSDDPMCSTTLIVVATNIEFNKTELTKLAMMASVGAGRCINPYHTNGDGDSTFFLSTRKLKSDLNVSVVGSLAAEVVSEAVLRAVKTAKSIENWPACEDYTL